MGEKTHHKYIEPDLIPNFLIPRGAQIFELLIAINISSQVRRFDDHLQKLEDREAEYVCPHQKCDQGCSQKIHDEEIGS